MDLSLKRYSNETQTLTAIIYLCWLAEGNTINNQLVTKSSLQGYMAAVRDYSQQSCGRDICLDPDPNKDKKEWTTHKMIRYIQNHRKKTKGRKQKKDPVTKRMISYLRKISKRRHEDNLTEALVDWLVLGLTTAYRGIKWCQTKDPTKQNSSGFKNRFRLYKDKVEYTDNPIYAKCIGNWTFYDQNDIKIKNPLNVDPNEIKTVRDWYRYQKNLSLNNTTLVYAATPEAPDWCPARAMI